MKERNFERKREGPRCRRCDLITEIRRRRTSVCAENGRQTPAVVGSVVLHAGKAAMRVSWQNLFSVTCLSFRKKTEFMFHVSCFRAFDRSNGQETRKVTLPFP
ncbi:hypothetical protein QL285_017835 [Trifolium repens]|nr:hypothetical protein QL285_017835 [Trifolium repens]